MDAQYLKQEARALVVPVLVLIITQLMAVTLLRRSAGLPGFGSAYLALIIMCAGPAVMLTQLRNSRGWLSIVVFVLSFGGLLYGIMSLGHVTTNAKTALVPQDIGVNVDLAEAVITCTRKNIQMMDHLPDDEQDMGWMVFYTYGVQNTLYKQYDYLPKKEFDIGQHVQVLYKLDRPALSRLVHPGETLPDGAAPHGASVTLPRPDTTVVAC